MYTQLSVFLFLCICVAISTSYHVSSTFQTAPTDGKLVNAWIFLNEDEPKGSDYNSANSTYQRLINEKVYQHVDFLNIAFFVTTPENGYYTLYMDPVQHSGGFTNQDYMKWVIRDARRSNPSIKILGTLDWGDDSVLSNIFAKGNPATNARQFAQNLVTYLKQNDMDGFDIDWESPLSSSITTLQFKLLFTAIRQEFSKQPKKYHLTMCPDQLGTLDVGTLNSCFDFATLQLYYDSNLPYEFINAGVNASLLAYGAEFESFNQNATEAYAGISAGIPGHTKSYNVVTQWRLNSENYIFEQNQQVLLYNLVHRQKSIIE